MALVELDIRVSCCPELYQERINLCIIETRFIVIRLEVSILTSGVQLRGIHLGQRQSLFGFRQ